MWEATVTAAAEFGVANTGNPFTKGTAEALGHDGFYINNQGMDCWSTYDEATLVYKQYTGDFDIRTRVLGQGASSQAARAGIMIRHELDEGKANSHSSNQEVHFYPEFVSDWDTNTLSYVVRTNIETGVSQFDRRWAMNANYRVQDGGTTANLSLINTVKVDGEQILAYDYLQAGNKLWLRLGRVGDVINSYYGQEAPEDNGEITWTLISSRVIEDMDQTVYAGPYYCLDGKEIKGCSESLTNEFKNPTTKFYMTSVDYVDDQVPYEGYIQFPRASRHRRS